MALIAGSIPDVSNSMAHAMEQAFTDNWPLVMKDKDGHGLPVPPMNDQMRLLFVSIAQGVVNHLAANSDAFVVKCPGTSTCSLTIVKTP